MAIISTTKRETQISDVFTPRSSTVNLKIYVPRHDLEQRLLRSIKGSMHSLLFGESGNGKSWLYKKVMDQEGIAYRTANCANASRLKSLTQEIVNALTPTGTSKKTGYTENKEAAIKALVAEGKLAHQNQYAIQCAEPLVEALSIFRESINSEYAVLVLDNLESIFDQIDLMNELADILILLDDERYAKHKIKFLIVGVPNGVLEYFAKTKNLESVSNRLEELPKVGGLNKSMINTILDRGFNNLLNYDISAGHLLKTSDHIHYVTMGVAQRVQEYCEKLAYKIEDNKGNFEEKLVPEADREWLCIGLRKAYTVVESHLNSRNTAVARRNQVIFCMGILNTHQFDSTKIVEKITEEFPLTIANGGMGVGGILNELSCGDSPLLKRNPKTKEYRIIDPRYIMCIRAMLIKNPLDSSVVKLKFAF
ncbi:AAA family ATPase [Rhodoferax sp. AJA081-3]|nr:AAA family ATPase [Rhodoferax sp. AJA081-3]